MKRLVVPVACVLALVISRSVDAQSGATNQQHEIVLGRGPIHEAFAEVIVFDPKRGVVVPREPPHPIPELPPDVKPAGSRVEWIAGYWSFFF